MCRNLCRPGAAPSAWVVGAVAFVLALGFMTANRALHGWPLAGAQVAPDVLGAALLLVWSRRAQWTPVHTLSAAGGALFAYPCAAFGQEPTVGKGGAVAPLSHIVFAAIAMALVAVALAEQRKRAPAGA